MRTRTAVIDIHFMAAARLAGGLSGRVARRSDAQGRQRDLPARVVAKMNAKGMTRASPIMMRIFKDESTLEVWKQKDDGRYGLIASYEICKWSGKLGPEEEGRRPPGAGRLLRHSSLADESEVQLLSLLQHRLSERL